jgi:hypothetical protein
MLSRTTGRALWLWQLVGSSTSASCSPHELDQRGVGDLRAFLLQPVPGAGPQLEATQVGDQRAQRGLQSGGVVGGDHHVAVAGQKQRGWGDLGAIPRRGESPVVVDVAVPVQRAEEVRLGELFDVGGDIPLGQPGGQLVGVDPPVEEALAMWDQQPPDFGVVAGEAEQDAPK